MRSEDRSDAPAGNPDGFAPVQSRINGDLVGIVERVKAKFPAAREAESKIRPYFTLKANRADMPGLA